jgi:4-amino-4-deoxy-L-arabinose transferase-like glycosyltransferase/membrane-associated phospholipid phosphatase
MHWLPTLDAGLFHWVNPTLSNSFLDVLMTFASGNRFFAPAFLLACALLIWKGGARGRVCVLMLVLAIALGDSVVCNTLKHLIHRPRPFHVIPDVHVPPGIGRTDSGSMPSSHAANWFAATMVLFIYYRRSLWFMLPLALIVSFSRIYNGVHYPSDILAGAILGAGYAAGIVWTLDALWQSVGRRWFPLWWQRLPSLLNPTPVTINPQSVPANQQLADKQLMRLGYLLIFIELVINLAYIASGKISLSEDEAYQWVWSKHLALSYYSKPLLIAVTQFLGTSLWGDTIFGIRFFAPVIGFIISLLLLRFIARTVNVRAAFWLSLIVPATPLLALGSVLMTIDPLSVLFWTLAMIAGWRAVQENSTTRDWLWVGLWMGLGFLSKYTALFQLLSWAVFFALWPPARRQLRRPGPYLALLVGMLCTAPVIIWNHQHGWITIQHVIVEGGHLDKPWAPTPANLWLGFTKYTSEFVGEEVGLLNPFFFLPAVWAAIVFWKCKYSHSSLQELDANTSSGIPAPREERMVRGFSKKAVILTPALSSPKQGESRRAGHGLVEPSKSNYSLLVYFFSMGAPLFLFYLLLTFHSRSLPNWIAPSILPLLCLGVVFWEARWRAGFRGIRFCLYTGLIAGCFAVVLLHDGNLIPKITGYRLPPAIDPMRRVQGWAETAKVVQAAREKLLAEGKPVFIIGEHYGITSQVTFNLPEAKAGVPDHPLVYYISSTNAENQYYFWPSYQDRKGQNAIFVQDLDLRGNKPDLRWRPLRRQFESIKDLGTVMVEHDGRPIRLLQIVECRSLR